MANLLDMINNPMKEYTFKNEKDRKYRKYRYNNETGVIEYGDMNYWSETDYKLHIFLEEELEEVLVYDKTALDIFNNEGKVYIGKNCGSLFKFENNKLMFKSSKNPWIEYFIDLNSFLDYKFAEYSDK